MHAQGEDTQSGPTAESRKGEAALGTRPDRVVRWRETRSVGPSYDIRVARLLAVADEVDHALYSGTVGRLAPDVIVACGDLPFDYLEYLLTMLNVPLLFVPGNHDPDLKTKPGGIDPEDFTRPFSFPRMRRGPAGPARRRHPDRRGVGHARGGG